MSVGMSEYPLLRYWPIKGLAVGLVRRYPLIRRYGKGDPFDYPLFIDCKQLEQYISIKESELQTLVLNKYQIVAGI